MKFYFVGIKGNVAQTLDLLYALLGRCQDEISALRIDTAPIKYSPVRVIDVDKLFSNVTESKTISEEFGKWNDNPSALIPSQLEPICSTTPLLTLSSSG